MPVAPRESVLVVAATAEEAQHVPDDVRLLVTGIGKTAAAVRTARALAELTHVQDLVVVNLGTAGALRDGTTGLFVVGEVLNHEVNADAVRALGHDPRERLRLGEEETVLATGDLFVTDPVVRDALARRAHLVDMEGYAVAWAAHEFGRSAVLVKHVSDNADESAWDWTRAVERSARALADWLEEHLR